MMKRLLMVGLILISVVICPLMGVAEENNSITTPGANDETVLSQIDALFEKGIDEYNKLSRIDTLKQSLEVCLEAIEKTPDSYELLWRGARSAGQYGMGASGLQVEGWKEICIEWGKKGSEFGLQAQEKAPDRVEGYYWQVVCVGKHALATGLATAMKEGFYGKSKNCIEKAYEKDKTYLDYSPAVSKSQFYFNLPWPLQDKNKALKHFEEFEANAKWTWEGTARRVVCAELLMSFKNDEYTNKAKKFLEIALADPYLKKSDKDKALALLEKLNK